MTTISNSPTEKKQKDYNFIVNNLKTSTHDGHLTVVNNMIDLFDVKWREPKSACLLNETVELKALLKHKSKNLCEYGVII